MAKGIEMNGMLRGKRGGVVYSRSNGEQISRVRVTQIANPKTTKQQAQRCIFATATAAYSKMKAICDHSFEGVKYGAKSQQAFMKENLALLRNRAAADEGNFLIPNISVLMANPYLISKGSLSNVQGLDILNGNDSIFTDSLVPVNGIISVKNFCDSLSIKKGDQITIVALVDRGGNPVGSYAGREYRNIHFVYCRMTVLPNAADNDVVYDSSEASFGNAIIVENIAPEATTNIDFSFTTSQTGSNFNVVSYDAILAMAVIRSAKEGDKWLRSTEHLTLNPEGLVYNFNDILPAWQEGTTPLEVGSERYLNNAEQEQIISTPNLVVRIVRTQNTSTGEFGNRQLATIDSGQYAGFVMVDDLDNKAPYTPVEGGWQKVAGVQPTEASNIITLALATRVIGYAPTIVTEP